MEKKTDTMLMHRSMERFISSRIKRASVCIKKHMQNKADMPLMDGVVPSKENR